MLVHSLAALLAVALFASVARAAPSPEGTWLTENGHGVIGISPCGTALCGRIVGIDRNPAEAMPKDVYGRPQCGLVIITKAAPTDDGAWSGEIMDPRTGNIYRTRFHVDAQGNLRLRGYVGIPLFGETQVWRPYTGRLTADCGMAAG